MKNYTFYLLIPCLFLSLLGGCQFDKDVAANAQAFYEERAAEEVGLTGGSVLFQVAYKGLQVAPDDPSANEGACLVRFEWKGRKKEVEVVGEQEIAAIEGLFPLSEESLMPEILQRHLYPLGSHGSIRLLKVMWTQYGAAMEMHEDGKGRIHIELKRRDLGFHYTATFSEWNDTYVVDEYRTRICELEDAQFEPLTMTNYSFSDYKVMENGLKLPEVCNAVLHFGTKEPVYAVESRILFEQSSFID